MIRSLTPRDIIVLGVRIDDISKHEILEQIKKFLGTQKQALVFTPNPEICLKAKENRPYQKLLNTSDLNIPDGVGLKLGAEILGQQIRNRMTGVDLTNEVLNILNAVKGKSLYIISKENALSSLNDIKRKLKETHPNINVTGINYNGRNLNTIIEQIRAIEPTVVSTVLGAPAQEEILVALRNAGVPFSLGLAVGGTFDFITGKQTRAPKWWRDLGMEWFYRFIKQPKRIGRITDATIKFPLACYEWKKSMETNYRKNVVAVITQKGKFLVQKNRRFSGEHWQFPQGGIDEGETAEQAAVREASEELGTDKKLFTPLKKLPATHKYSPSRWHQLLRGYRGQEQQFFLLNYTGTDQDFNLEESEEAEAIKWVSKDDLSKIIHQHRKEALQKIMPYL